jgi:hypothetical protein
MTDVFISYSRKDGEFMRYLHSKLKDAERDVWVDWEDIPATADWWAEIKAAIEAADAFAFIISSNSVRSEVCYREIQHALDNNKRFIPLLFTEVSDEDAPHMHPAIRSHNWIPFSDDKKYDESVQKLLDALNTDPDYLRRHTRLLVRAKEWIQHKRHSSYLLKGAELGEYQKWLQESQILQPKPTEIQLEYVLASQSARARNQMRFAIASIAAVIVFAIVVGVALLQSQKLRETAALGTIAAQEQDSTSQAQLVTSQAQETQIAAQATNIAAIRSDSQSLITQAYIQNTQSALQTENAGLRETITALQSTPTIGATVTVSSSEEPGDAGIDPEEETIAPTFAPTASPSQDNAESQGFATSTRLPAPTMPPPSQLPTRLPDAGGGNGQETPNYFVNPFGDDSRNCESPNQACLTIEAAIAKASEGQIIGIAPGVYETVLVIDKSIRLHGLVMDGTVINGNFAGSVITIAETAEVEIRNLTITGGAALFGGGILNYGSLDLSSVHVIANFADLAGGGIANFGQLDIDDSIFDENYALVIPEIYTAAVAETIVNGEVLASIGEAGEIGHDVLIMINTTDGDNLRMRSEPGLNTGIVSRIPPDTPAIVLDGPADADGLIWWRIYLASGETGWVVQTIDDIEVVRPIE